jgi:hypothetical protein
MKYLLRPDLYLLIKLVNQSDEQLRSALDMAQMAARQDREHKGLPALAQADQDQADAQLKETIRRMTVIRNRLIQELQASS